MSKRVALAPLASRDVPVSPSGLSPPAASRAFIVVHTDAAESSHAHAAAGSAAAAGGGGGGVEGMPPGHSPPQPGAPERGASERGDERDSDSESDSRLRARRRQRSRARRHEYSSADDLSDGSSSFGWQSFVKKNTPALISVMAVVLNVLVLSILIPSMKADIVYMQGQAASVQSQVNSMQHDLFTVGQQVMGAGTAITSFYADLGSITRTFNETKTDIIAFRANTQLDLLNMQASSAQTLNEFTQASAAVSMQLSAFQLQLNTSIASAQMQSAAIEQQLSAAQATVQSSMRDLLSNSSAARASISDTAALYSSAAQASLQSLLAANSSAVLRLESTRDEFVQRTVPQLTADLRALNQSAAIAALQAPAVLHNVSYRSPWHTYNDGTEYLVSFSLHHGTVRLQGLIAGGSTESYVFTLPVGFRPPVFRTFTVYTNSGPGRISVYANGDVAWAGASSVWSSLDGVAFTVAS